MHSVRIPLAVNTRLRCTVRNSVFTFVTVGLCVLLTSGNASAATAPGLGAGESFAVLAGSGITNTGPTTITGDVGTFPTPAEVGFGSITLNGTNHGGDAVTQLAKTNLTTAYNNAAAAGPATSVATELGNRVLTPGVYSSPTLAITGTLTLDTQGDPAAVFIFQAASTLITASASSVVVLNGGIACNVFWQVGSSATLGTNSHLIGSVLAEASITATTGSTIEGRLLARTAAVTLDTNVITVPICPQSTTPTSTSTTAVDASGGTTTTSTPDGSVTGSENGRGGSGGNASGSGTSTGLAASGIDERLPIAGALLLVSGAAVLAVQKTRRRSAK